MRTDDSTSSAGDPVKRFVESHAVFVCIVCIALSGAVIAVAMWSLQDLGPIVTLSIIGLAPAPAPVTCSTATTARTVAGTFDGGDRITNTGYTYDTVGRTLTVPAADATSSPNFPGATGNLTLGYYANDMAATETQSSWTMAYSLDPIQDRIASATATNGATTTTTVNDYADNSDSPAWFTIDGVWTRTVPGLAGILDATVAQTGTVTLHLTNLQGSEVATAADSTSDTNVDSGSYATFNEYGIPTNTAACTATYGWLGGNERSADSLGGLVLMGARLYNDTTGRFLSSYARGARRHAGESLDQATERVMKGAGRWPPRTKGAGSEYSKIRRYLNGR